MQLPTGDERAYIVTYGIVAVYVAVRPDGRAVVRRSRDLLLSAEATYRRWGDTVLIHAAYWMNEFDEACQIVRAVNDDRSCLVSLDHAKRGIERYADRLGIALTDHEVVLQRAADVVKIINAKIEEFHETGEFKWFNRAYAAWCAKAKKHGMYLSYRLAIARLRRRMFACIRSGSVIYDGDPMNIFPRLPTQD